MVVAKKYLQDRKRIQKTIKRMIVFIGALALLVGGVVCQQVKWAKANSALISLQTSSQTITKGTVFYVVVSVQSSTSMSGFAGTFSYNTSKIKYLGGGAVVKGGAGAFTISDTGRETGVTTIKYSIKFQAKAMGSSIIYLKSPYAVYASENSTKMSASFNSLVVKVGNQSKPTAVPSPKSILPEQNKVKSEKQMPSKQMPGGSMSPKGQRAQGSAAPSANDTDSLLKELSVQGMSLTPTFDAKVFRYSGMISTNEKSLTILYKAQSDKAQVRIVGNKKIKQGKNEIRIIVTGESGIKSVYLLSVTKGNASPNGDSVDTSLTATSKDGIITLHQSQNYQMVNLEDTSKIPEGFKEMDQNIGGFTIKAYVLTKEKNPSYILLYGRKGNEDPEFYLYDKQEGSMSPYEHVKAWYGIADKTKQTEDADAIKVKSLQYVIGILAGICGLLVIILISVLLFFKRYSKRKF